MCERFFVILYSKRFSTVLRKENLKMKTNIDSND